LPWKTSPSASSVCVAAGGPIPGSIHVH
jgi:hypothetical protein